MRFKPLIGNQAMQQVQKAGLKTIYLSQQQNIRIQILLKLKTCTYGQSYPAVPSVVKASTLLRAGSNSNHGKALIGIL